ncbi:natural killer cell receptor 2B4 [Balaenoptera musculus]|uniref:Natural killer cell receptor 2B4 n=1 Tax=Balaenoptera musculus TaxID=9771 RepID=A0A8B8V359_BALMU|nr:natural killer cell receptor 2B4 [Balaenoptera musculus]
MLGQALTLTLLLLIKGHRGQGSADHVVGISGESVWLRPPSIQIRTYSVKWKMQPYSNSSCFLIHSWKNVSSRSDVGKSLNWTPNHFNNRLSFISENLTLLIMAVQQQDSGLYFLEVTEDTGKVWRHKFQVSVFESLLPDRVEKPQLVERWKVLDRGMCQVTLSCSVSRGGDVSYAWYKGTELIQTPRNLTKLEEQIDVSGLHTYTCNVSNPVSWANHTLQLTQGCLNAHPSFIFLSILVSIVILLTALFLGTLTCFCVRRWKRKQSRKPEEFLTIYEDVNNVQTRRNQEQNSPGEGCTIYSMIQSQSSASTSQDNANTLYSLVQSSWKSGSKKMNHNTSFNKTVYEEVGKRASKAVNPARLSRRELENFCVYP